ncbi:hypothetical protein [Streptomyces parvus]|uniref:hypothetical protein n=1 Tax=Streptomyces parvus TaxID=66428 RepID=UPI0036755AF0
MIHCLAQEEGPTSSYTVDTRQAATPRAALRWLRSQAAEAATRLDPQPDRAPLTLDHWRAAEALRRWADDMASHETAIEALAAGNPVSITTEPGGITLTAVPRTFRLPPWAPTQGAAA